MERKWWTLIAVSLAVFMLLLDITVVNVALPSIQRSLHTSFEDLQWVVDAYALTLAAFLLTSGGLADLLGRKRVFVVGLIVFTLASAACGLSTTSLMLNLARGAQGVGGAIMFATSLALIAQAFQSGRERGTAFGVYGAVVGVAVAIGPLIGGILTSGIGWEWIFFVNLPIGALAVFITVTQVEESRDPEGTRIDWAGLLTFSASLFLLVFGLVRGNDKGWGSTQIVALLAGSAALLILFVVLERAQERPMLDLSLFRSPAFAGASIIALTLAASMFAMFLYLTLYVQNVLGYGALQTGLRFLPITATQFVVAPFAGRLSARIPVRILLGGGMLLVGVALLLMMTAITPTSGWTALIAGFAVSGAGIGMVNPSLASTAIAVVPPERSGMASGINNTFRQVGIATGIAGLGAVFQHEITHRTATALAASGHVQEVVAAAHGKLASALQAGGVTSITRSLSPTARTAFTHAYHVGFTGALTEILTIAGVIALIGAVLGFALVRSRDFAAAGPSAEAAEPAPVSAAAA